MKLDYQLKLEQTQKLIITPELKLAISLLQYSTVELLNYLQQELQENPVLEAGEAEDSEREVCSPEEPTEAEDDFPWEEYFRDRSYESFDPVYPAREPLPSVENYAGEARTLAQELTEQLSLLPLPAEERSVAIYLVGNLDSRGYLQGELEELARPLDALPHELESALKVIQGLDPAGVGCRDLRECLTLQLERDNNPSPLAMTIVREFLPAVADGRFEYIVSRLRCGRKEIREAIDLIRTLNPKPGSGYSGGSETSYIIPDLVVEKVGGDYWVVVNDSSIPYLNINPFYQNLVKASGGDRQLSSFVKRKLESALWLIRSIEQRRLTLFRVASQLVELQRGFLDQGIKRLKPLTLKEVAQRVGVHESTVSRATANKYMQTPRGLFPLRFFFSGGLTGTEGEDYSSRCIKTFLKELIREEDPDRPFSDLRLADLLLEQNIVISRRTVAKYREEINIPSSHKRRRI